MRQQFFFGRNSLQTVGKRRDSTSTLGATLQHSDMAFCSKTMGLSNSSRLLKTHYLIVSIPIDTNQKAMIKLSKITQSINNNQRFLKNELEVFMCEISESVISWMKH